MEEQDRINQQEWQRPENWCGPLRTYCSPRDTRIWVPKRNPALGWTVNCAHRAGRWWLVGLFTVPIAFLLLLVLYQILR